jgi:lauroyl/myristoyl acyltransferase
MSGPAFPLPEILGSVPRRPLPLGPSQRVHHAWTRHLLNTGVIFGATYRGVSWLPRSVSHGIGHVGTALAYRLMRPTTNALVQNFQGAFPRLSDAEARRLALATYRSYARDVIDFMRSLSIGPDRARGLFHDRHPKGYRVFERLIARRRGVILVSGHYGNWEIGSLMLQAYGYPLTIVAMPEANEDINRLRLTFRERLGAQTVEVGRSLDTALQIRRHLAENRVVALLMDRHVGRDRVPVTFFNRLAFFLRTPPLLAYLTGAPLLPCAIVRRPEGGFWAIPGEPIDVPRSGDPESAVQHAAQVFAAQLEALIHEAPQFWYQFYPYWEAQAAAAMSPQSPEEPSSVLDSPRDLDCPADRPAASR